MKKETLKESNKLDDLEIEEMSNDWETMSQQISTTTKQTAVEWLVEKIQQANPTFKFNALIRQAKAMEKAQIMQAVYDSMGTNFDPNMGRAELYYNEKYKLE